MARDVLIQIDDVSLEGALNDTKTARAVWDALPFEAQANMWGEEIYFAIPVKLELENGQEVVQVGDLGYWPPGNAFCIFFGPTPVSRGKEIRPASAVTVLGKVTGRLSDLRSVRTGTRVEVSRRA